MIPKIERFCSSYLHGISEVKTYASQPYGKTALAALKIFTYIASLTVLPIIALGVRYVCRKISAPLVPNPIIPRPVMPLPTQPTNRIQKLCVVNLINALKSSQDNSSGALGPRATFRLKKDRVYTLSSIVAYDSTNQVITNPMQISHFHGTIEGCGNVRLRIYADEIEDVAVLNHQ